MTEYDPDIHHRQSMRLKGFDYSSNGFYFITLCVHEHKCMFGSIVGATCRSPGINAVPYEMKLNPYGIIVHDEWLKTSVIRPNILLDKFIIMPNHFHAIVRIQNGTGQHTNESSVIAGDRQVAPTGPAACSIGAVLAGFKSAVTKRINEIRQTPRVPVWQRNYYEHIIRDQNAFAKIRQYVADNPKTWAYDKLNPHCIIPAENNSCLIENPVE